MDGKEVHEQIHSEDSVQGYSSENSVYIGKWEEDEETKKAYYRMDIDSIVVNGEKVEMSPQSFIEVNKNNKDVDDHIIEKLEEAMELS